MHDAGLLEVAEEVHIRGGRAKRYRRRPDSGKRLTTRAPGEEKLLTKAIANELLRRAGSRVADRPASLTDAEPWVAPELWARLLEKATALSEELHAAARPPRTPGTVRVSLALFELGSADS